MGSYQPAASGLGRVFAHPGVADAYRHRPPYPAEVFAILRRLITAEPRDVLDRGAGDGALARPLAARVDHVDAGAVSAAMVAAGRARPGGRRAGLRWIVGAAESGPLAGPYALVTAGASLPWMEWGPVMARPPGAMTDHASLAVVEHGVRDVPWAAGLAEVIARHSRSPDFEPRYSLVDALRAAGHFDPVDRAETRPVPFRQTVAGYVEQFHSTASLARELMSPAEATAFDRGVEEVVRPWSVGGVLEITVVATLAWGRPRTPAAAGGPR